MDSRTALFACAVLFAAIAVHAAPQDKAPAASAPAAPPAAPSADDKYTTKYDNLDIDQVLASKRLVNQYVQCLLDKKPCTADAAELRSTCTGYIINFLSTRWLGRMGEGFFPRPVQKINK